MLRSSWSPRWVVEIFRQRVDSLFLWVAFDKGWTQASNPVFCMVLTGVLWGRCCLFLTLWDCADPVIYTHIHSFTCTCICAHTHVKWRDLKNFVLYSKVYLTCLQLRKIFIVCSIYAITIICSTAIYAEDIKGFHIGCSSSLGLILDMYSSRIPYLIP